MRLVAFILTLAAVLLPLEAVVQREGMPGSEWCQSGEIRLAFAAACRTMESKLEYTGWKQKDTFMLAPRKKLSIWKNGDRQITVLIWEKKLDRSGFSWGYLMKEQGEDHVQSK